MGKLVLVGGRLCLDFCNTQEYRGSPKEVDFLIAGFGALVDWSAHAGAIEESSVPAIRSAAGGAPMQAAEVFERAMVLRRALQSIFGSVLNGEIPSPESREILALEFERASLRRTLVPAPVGNWSWRWKEINSLDAMVGPIALSAVQLLSGDELGRLRACPGCGWLFYDQSRNRSRTWCDMQFCGNRAKVKRFVDKAAGKTPS